MAARARLRVALLTGISVVLFAPRDCPDTLRCFFRLCNHAWVFAGVAPANPPM